MPLEDGTQKASIIRRSHVGGHDRPNTIYYSTYAITRKNSLHPDCHRYEDGDKGRFHRNKDGRLSLEGQG